MGFSPRSTVLAQDFRDISSAKQLRLGEKAETVDGRVYRYALAGASDLAPGKVCVAEAIAANHVNKAVSAAAAVGATQVSATLGATAAAANLYQDGMMVVSDDVGEGISYLIASHNAVLSAGVLTANLVDSVKVALTTASEVSFHRNPWAGAIISPGAIAHRPIGVPNVTVTAAYYGWLQTGGECAVLADGVISKGAGAILSDAVNGALEIEVAATIVKRVGFAPEATVDTEYRPIILTLD
jgi:hypothetical protein